MVLSHKLCFSVPKPPQATRESQLLSPKPHASITSGSNPTGGSAGRPGPTSRGGGQGGGSSEGFYKFIGFGGEGHAVIRVKGLQS